MDNMNKTGSDTGTEERTIKRILRERSSRRPLQLKLRQKRQTMQNMTRPLKQWLCKNRDNPYPSKLEKEILARESQMTNTQVSNWFANARRRLKNAVKGDNIPWSTRVKLYNNSVPGNAELLSISSDDSSLFDSDDNDDSLTNTDELNPAPDQRVGFNPVTDDPPPNDDVVVPSRSQTPTSGFFPPGLESDFHKPFRECMYGPQSKFKQTILQRYLSDTCNQASATHVDMEMSAFNKTRSRKPSGSIGSRDYEEMSTASGFSSAAESQFYYPMDDPVDELEAAARRRRISGDVRRQDDIHWKEISAAMALTSLARGNRYPYH
ncbi:homeobox protein Mohawk-like isoform X2 [Ostrea edulis]|uniref:homeobox protein Mohawk-like isoform X2 n=1 Tax=Ostrea edulis TaxID=37623 RepID=UPI0024AFC954|nr:homeobox protein Mohawk-like isoform X2 [Ostrea edulis]